MLCNEWFAGVTGWLRTHSPFYNGRNVHETTTSLGQERIYNYRLRENS